MFWFFEDKQTIERGKLSLSRQIVRVYWSIKFDSTFSYKSYPRKVISSRNSHLWWIYAIRSICQFHPWRYQYLRGLWWPVCRTDDDLSSRCRQSWFSSATTDGSNCLGLRSSWRVVKLVSVGSFHQQSSWEPAPVNNRFAPSRLLWVDSHFWVHFLMLV